MKRGIPIKFAKIDSPSTSEDWKLRSEKDRLSLIEDSLKNFPESEKINLKKVSVDGQLIISFEGILNAGERGVLLLDFEEYLKDKIDLGIFKKKIHIRIFWSLNLHKKGSSNIYYFLLKKVIAI